MADIRPDDIARRTFRSTFRGYDPTEVAVFLAELAERLDALQAERDALADRLRSLGGARDLTTEIDVTVSEVASVLHTAREVAERIEREAAEHAATVRAEADAYAATTRAEADVDAEALRRDAWVTGTELLDQATAEAKRLRETAERDALAIVGEAEREAHRKTAAARREADDLLRNARMEAERLLVEAKTRHDEIIATAREAAEVAQERARALEQRREELLAELESVRGTISKMEAEIEERREALAAPVDSSTVRVLGPAADAKAPELPPAPAGASGGGDAASEADEEEHDPWAIDTVRVIPATKAPRPATTIEPEPVDAEALAAEVTALRAGAGSRQAPEEIAEPPTEAEAAQPSDAETAAPEAVPSPEVAEEREEEPRPEEPEAEEPPPSAAPDLELLFAQLRGGRATTPVAETAPQATHDEETPPAVVEAEEAPAAERIPFLDDAALFDLRDRALLPIANRLLRSVKRHLTEAQNVALEAIRTAEGDWAPEPDDLRARIHGDLNILVQEAFAAGWQAVEDASGRSAGRVSTRKADVPDHAPEFAEALVDDLVEALASVDADARKMSTVVSRVYRAWRTDQAERRLREYAAAAYQRGALRALEKVGAERVRWVLSGIGCETCRAAAEASPVPIGEPFVDEVVAPPAHVGCTCVLAPA